MRPLTTERALRAWEEGQRRDPLGRALALLSAALDDVGWEELAALPIGQRDALLITLRQMSVGPQIRGFARCPRCQTALEFGLDLRTFDAAGQLDATRPPEWFSTGSYEIFFRLPSSDDLKMVSDYCLEAGSGREMLLDRCVLEVRHRGKELSARDLPEKVIRKLGERMEERDPLAEMPLAIDCAQCGHAWKVLLDVGTLMWDEVTALSKRLLHEVHVLARAYGWTESEILRLSAARRRYYIDQIRPASEEESGRAHGAR